MNPSKPSETESVPIGGKSVDRTPKPEPETPVIDLGPMQKDEAPVAGVEQESMTVGQAVGFMHQLAHDEIATLTSRVAELEKERDEARLRASDYDYDRQTLRAELQSAKDAIDKHKMLGVINGIEFGNMEEQLRHANAEIERLRQAVSSAANVFRSYVAIHHLKHTPEGDEKAKSNATMAALMELALAGQDSK